LETLAKKFKEERKSDLHEEELKMSNFFDENLRKFESGSMAKKMSLRRPTKKLDGTVLSRKKNVSCVIQR
jgi:hypothetical protein